jgi:hypothetical protein
MCEIKTMEEVSVMGKSLGWSCEKELLLGATCHLKFSGHTKRRCYAGEDSKR